MKQDDFSQKFAPSENRIIKHHHHWCSLNFITTVWTLSNQALQMGGCVWEALEKELVSSRVFRLTEHLIRARASESEDCAKAFFGSDCDLFLLPLTSVWKGNSFPVRTKNQGMKVKAGWKLTKMGSLEENEWQLLLFLPLFSQLLHQLTFSLTFKMPSRSLIGAYKDEVICQKSI